jgi:hypothetical protein
VESSATEEGNAPVTAIANARREQSHWRYALVLALSLRVIYSLIAALSGLIESPPWDRIRSNALTENLAPPNHTLHYLLLGVWERFDTLWYIHIAQRGYQNPASVVFFPLYPSLIRVSSFLIPPISGALLIATVSAFFVFFGLQELWSQDYPQALARQSAIICSLWPGSFALFAGYADSLVFALIVWSLVLARRQRWILAAILGLAGSLTKAVGVVVVVPLLIMAIRQRKAGALAVLMIPFGPAIFWGYLNRADGPTFEAAYAEYWRTVMAPPWITLGHALAQLSPRSPDGMLILTLSLLLAVAVLAAASRARIEYLIYAAAAILIFLCKETKVPLQSMIRYLLIVFPAYMGLARLLQRPWLQKRFAMVMAVLFALNATLLWFFLNWWLVV